MLNMGKMMKQVQDMQAKMTELQARVGEIEMTGQAGGDKVIATMGGKGELKKIKIDPSVIDPADPEMLEDLVVAACRDAKTKIDRFIEEETQKAMGGMSLPPGLSLPF